MIQLKELSLRAFRSFVDETIITFPNNGLILINGQNLQTLDGSGTGKSSIFYGIAYALNILPSGMAAKDLQSFLTKEKMQVNLTLQDSNIGQIKVGKGAKTFIEYSGDRFEGAELVNSHLEKVFGLNSEMLYTLVFRPQNTKGLFLDKTDSEKKEFLSGLLGLHKFENAIDLSEKLIKQYTNDLTSIEGQIKAKNEVLTKIKTEDISKDEVEYQGLCKELLNLNSINKTLESELDSKEQEEMEYNKAIDLKYAKLEEEHSEVLKSLKNQDLVRKNQLAAHNKRLKETTLHKHKLLASLTEKKKQIKQIDKQIDELEQNNCPTCLREWRGADYSEELRKKLDHKRLLELEISQEDEIKRQISNLESNISTFEPNPEIDLYEVAITNMRNHARSEHLIGSASGVANMISKNLRDINLTAQKANALKSKIDLANQNNQLKESISKELKILEDKKSDVLTSIQFETDFCKAVGKEGFLGSIFDEVLVEIVSEINSKLSIIANMSTVTFNFKTETLNSKGLVKKSIVPVVCISGHETKINALSGGMASSLDLMVDLAVKAVIERRTGKQIGFYFLDEAFNGLGKISVESCLEILSAYASNRAVFVIDHGSETKETFNQVINVSMNNGTSKIT